MLYQQSSARFSQPFNKIFEMVGTAIQIFAKKMESVLQALLSNDNHLRPQAEATYTRLKGEAPRQVLIDIIGAMRTASTESYRGLAAILLRGITLREEKLWQSLNAEDIGAARREMLLALSNEPVPFIQRKIIDTVAVHAKLAEWPELMEAVIAMQSSVESRWKIVSLQLVDKLAEYVGPFLVAGNNYPVTLSVIQAGMELADPRVRCSAYLALLSVLFEVSTLDATAQRHLEAFPTHCLEPLHAIGDDSSMVDLLSAISRLLRHRPAYVAVCSQALLQTCLAISANHQHLEEGTRISAIDIACALLTNPVTSRVCSTAQTRQQLLLTLIELIACIDGDSAGALQLLTRPESGQGFGDVDGDGDGENIAEYAAMCLSNVSETFSSSETVATCLQSAWTQLQQSDWRRRRAALFVLSSIADSCRSSLRKNVPQIVQTAVGVLSKDAHPRVLFSAAHCLSVLVEVFGTAGDDDDDDDDETTSIKNFQENLHAIMVPAIFGSIPANITYPRTVYMCLYTMRLFFDPDNNPDVKDHSAVVEPYAATILDACLSLLSESQAPMFVCEEVASLLGNVCVLCANSGSAACIAVVEARYERVTQTLLHLMQLLSPGMHAWWAHPRQESTGAAGSLPNAGELSSLKGKCLECFALLGRALGCDRYLNHALAMLNTLVDALSHTQPSTSSSSSSASLANDPYALDASDVLVSYILQACVRIAGVIKHHFAPFVSILLPHLLQRVQDSINVNLVDPDASMLGNGAAASGNSNSANTFQVYKRGVGEVQIVCDTHQILDKEMTCRVLMQALLDIPSLMLPYLPQIVAAVVPNIDSVQLSENLAVICGSTLAECVKVAVNYYHRMGDDSNRAAAEFSHLCSVSVSALLQGIQKLQLVRSYDAQTHGGHAQSAQVDSILGDLLDSTRELLRHVWDHSNLFHRPACIWEPINIVVAEEGGHTGQRELMHELMLRLRDEAVTLMQAATAGKKTASDNDEEDDEAEADNWDGLIDCMCWVIKLFGPNLKQAFDAELLPLCQGIVSSPSLPVNFMSFALCCLVESIDALPVSGPVPGAAALSTVLCTHISTPELAIVCSYGIGVCAHRGVAEEYRVTNAAMQAVGVISAQLAAIQVATGDGHGNDVEDADEEQLCVRDNLISSLLKLFVYRHDVITATFVDEVGPFVCSKLPIKSDVFEARLLHAHVVSLMEATISGQFSIASASLFQQLFAALVRIASVSIPTGPDPLSKNYDAESAHLDHWNEQILNPHTQQRARVLVQSVVRESNYFRSQAGITTTNMPAGIAVTREAIDALLLAQPAESRTAIAVLMS